MHFVFNQEYMRAFYMRSDEDGLTFSKPVEITPTFDAFRPEYAWKVPATGPGRHGRARAPSVGRQHHLQR